MKQLANEELYCKKRNYQNGESFAARKLQSNLTQYVVQNFMKKFKQSASAEVNRRSVQCEVNIGLVWDSFGEIYKNSLER